MTTPEDYGTAPILRPAVRVIVIDEDERTLLFASTDDDHKRFWVPVSGSTGSGTALER